MHVGSTERGRREKRRRSEKCDVGVEFFPICEEPLLRQPDPAQQVGIARIGAKIVEHRVSFDFIESRPLPGAIGSHKELGTRGRACSGLAYPSVRSRVKSTTTRP